MINNKRQTGASVANLMFGLLIAIFLASVAYALVPAYLDNRLVTQGLKELAERYSSEELRVLSKGKINAEMQKFYQLNNIREPAIIASLEVIKEKERALINVNYERRQRFWGNIDIVSVYNNQLDTSKPQECCSPSEE